MSPAEQAGVEAALASIKAVSGRWRRDTPVAQMRADWDGLFPATGNAAFEPVQVQDVPCAWVTAPGADATRVVVYFHGGGFQLGSLASHRELMALISAASGVRVLGVSYRLAPEHRFPAPLCDAVTVLQWLRQSGYAAQDVALVGDSAGGGLAVSAMLELQEHGLALPCAAWLMSPWTDLTASGSSYTECAGLDPLHQKAMMQAIARNYLGSASPQSPQASPLLAAAERLAALPPLLVQVGEREVVRSDAEDLTRKVRAAGGQAELAIWPGMFHVFQQFPHNLQTARDAIAAGGQFLATHLRAAANRKKTP